MDFFDNPYTEAHEPSGYDTAQFCLNGHCITSCAATSPEFTSKFCRTCGAQCITHCPSCRSTIRGYFHVPGMFGSVEISTPSFCHECGKPYPWVAANLEAAKSLADELDELQLDERELLKSSLEDLIRDTPKTQVAIVRFKKLLPKAGRGAAEAMRRLLIDVVSEAVKKSIWPQ